MGDILKALVVALTVSATSVAAQTNPINGNFGAFGGCDIARNPNAAAGDDRLVLLRPNAVQLYAADCRITRIALTGDGGALLDLACGTEEGVMQSRANLRPLANGQGFVMQFGGESRQTELTRC